MINVLAVEMLKSFISSILTQLRSGFFLPNLVYRSCDITNASQMMTVDPSNETCSVLHWLRNHNEKTSCFWYRTANWAIYSGVCIIINVIIIAKKIRIAIISTCGEQRKEIVGYYCDSMARYYRYSVERNLVPTITVKKYIKPLQRMRWIYLMAIIPDDFHSQNITIRMRNR